MVYRSEKLNSNLSKRRKRRVIKNVIYPKDVIHTQRQHNEMCHIHSTMEKITSSELESIFAVDECEGSDIECTLHRMWEDDQWASLEAQRNFQEDQENNSKLGCIHWLVVNAILITPFTYL